MNILIFGGTGNISSFFVKECIKKKINTEIVIRNSKNHLRELCKSKFLKKTFCDINTIKKKKFKKILKIKKYDCIINFICYNGRQASNCYSLIKNITNRFLLISTTAGYIKNKKYLPYNETTKFKSKWSYVKNKKLCENFFLKIKDKNFNVNVIRFGHTYGHIFPFPIGPVDWTIPYLLKKNYPVLVHNKGLSEWSLLHAEDAASALLKIVENKKINNDFINVVSKNKITWIDIVKKIFRIFRKKENIKYININLLIKKCKYFGESVMYHKQFDEYYDCTLINKIIPNWSERVSINDGLKKTYRWFISSKKRMKINKKNINLLKTIYS